MCLQEKWETRRFPGHASHGGVSAFILIGAKKLRENEAVFCEVSDGKARCPSALGIDPAL